MYSTLHRNLQLQDSFKTVKYNSTDTSTSANSNQAMTANKWNISLCNINKINVLLQRLFAVVPHSNILQSEDTPSLLYLSYKLRGDQEKENYLLIIQNFSMLCYVRQQPVYLRSCEDTPKGKLVIFFLLLFCTEKLKLNKSSHGRQTSASGGTKMHK